LQALRGRGKKVSPGSKPLLAVKDCATGTRWKQPGVPQLRYRDDIETGPVFVHAIAHGSPLAGRSWADGTSSI
jgi:hypothetical protein